MEYKIKKIKCIKCPFYSGEECCGHGDYHGSCGLVSLFSKVAEKSFNCWEFDVYLKGSSSSWDTCIDDESTCLLFEIHKRIK